MKLTKEEVERWRNWWRNGVEAPGRAYARDAATVCDAYLALLDENEKLKDTNEALKESLSRWIDRARTHAKQCLRQAEVVEAARRITEFNGIGIGGSALSPQEVMLLNKLRKALAQHDGVSRD